MRQGPGDVRPAGADQWCQVPWKDWPGFVLASIAAMELLPIIVATTIWGPWWKGSVVMYHCDNEAVVASIKEVIVETLRCCSF